MMNQNQFVRLFGHKKTYIFLKNHMNKNIFKKKIKLFVGLQPKRSDSLQNQTFVVSIQQGKNQRRFTVILGEVSQTPPFGSGSCVLGWRLKRSGIPNAPLVWNYKTFVSDSSHFLRPLAQSPQLSHFSLLVWNCKTYIWYYITHVMASPTQPIRVEMHVEACGSQLGNTIATYSN